MYSPDLCAVIRKNAKYASTNHEVAMERLTTSDAAAPAESGIPQLHASTRLAYERTRVAYDRTVMAAVRTATSLITFGFTVYKFFELEMKGKDFTSQLVGPRGFGITLILIGLVSLSIATFEYRRYLKEMRKLYSDMPRSTAGVVAALIAGLGILALLLAVFRQ
jgi:putative membrane protein